MKNSIILRVLCIAALFSIKISLAIAEEVELVVNPNPPGNLQRVLLRFSNPLMPQIDATKNGPSFNVTIDIVDWNIDLDLIARDVSGTSFPLYLRLRKIPRGQTRQLEIYAEVSGTDLGSIKTLQERFQSSDELTLLEVYFKARDICHYWQTQNKEHLAGIISCRLWFDASAKLAENDTYPYRMDQAAIDTMQSYEKEIKVDPAFEARYRDVVDNNYVATIASRFVAPQFADAKYIRDLIRSGSLDDAKVLNDYLLHEWQGLSENDRHRISVLHGVDLTQLQSNRDYINTLMKQ